jgi:HK97 family phage major capsid protein
MVYKIRIPKPWVVSEGEGEVETPPEGRKPPEAPVAQTEDQVRAIFREELQDAMKDLTAPKRDTEREELAAALAGGERYGGAGLPTPEEAQEVEHQVLAEWEKSMEEIARKTGGILPVYHYPRKFSSQARHFADIRSGGIVERALRGDTKPAIRVLNYFRAMAEGNVTEARKWGGRRALGEATLSAGGALVPEEFGQDVIAKLGDLTPFATREFMRIVPMATDVSTWPRLTGLPAATFGTEGEAWSTDEAKGTEPTFGDVELVAREAVLIVPVSEQVIADATIQLIDYLIDLFAEALARLRNSMVLTGNGTNEPEGVTTNAGIGSGSYDNTNSGTAQDSINAAYHGIPARYRVGAIWVVSDVAHEVLSNVRATDYQPIMSSILDEPFMRLKGKPLFITEAMADAEALFGNFLFYLFGDRMQMQAATDRGGTFFKKRQVAIRVTERYDGKVAQGEAFYLMDSIT